MANVWRVFFRPIATVAQHVLFYFILTMRCMVVCFNFKNTKAVVKYWNVHWSKNPASPCHGNKSARFGTHEWASLMKWKTKWK
jgi:hypothetical protein